MDDMDIDIPHPEELEWLEEHSHFQDDHDEEIDEQPQPQSYIPDDQTNHDLSKPSLSIPPIHSPIADQQTPPPESQSHHSGKRVRSDGSDSSTPDDISGSGEKRFKTRDLTAEDEDEDEDEDWLHYSPPPETADAPEEVILEVITLSRRANEIDGDVFPVTGLDGDRVYAKIITASDGDVPKKLNIKAKSFGMDGSLSLFNYKYLECFSNVCMMSGPDHTVR